jgi:hypothetical protein
MAGVRESGGKSCDERQEGGGYRCMQLSQQQGLAVLGITVNFEEPVEIDLIAYKFEQGSGTTGGACCTREAFAILQVGLFPGECGEREDYEGRGFACCQLPHGAGRGRRGGGAELSCPKMRPKMWFNGHNHEGACKG